MATNELFQYSIVSALMDGVASTGLPINTLLSHGDHGLGTFRYIVGEMIILDGQLYQMKSDGSVLSIEPSNSQDIVAPFAMVTHFQPTAAVKSSISSKSELFDLLTDLLPSARNHYIAMRIDGVFKAMTVRTVGGQQSPGEGLAEVGKHQVSHNFKEPTSGTIIGFRSPEYMQGISVAGDHLHFISADRKKGGHLLALESDGEVEIQTADISTVRLELPCHDAEFDKAKLKGDRERIMAVEG
ncbi:alpha-acetolactate decarboxylase [Pseudomassariella vexata]|uniref:Alpha-acetolactate decarboxylase n=1 Tax=Pseudomassariella vexata TaxID=1141098 RepID=A0A1Y2EH68_9PEZI|nr:alpha-acetolactate decarboxylase [Pseudomassariella vexata]ORY70920.1 alpha-acetolactate decarboxylase [Pseudomassariella vexata]